MNLVLIAALDRRGAIGRGNALPWRLPEDLKRFKSLTLDRTVLMGRKTAESLGRALPGRRNLVLSHSAAISIPGMLPVHSLAQAQAAAAGSDLVVIGGGQVYALALPIATRMWLTHVDTEVPDADAHFPVWNATEWRVTAREKHTADGRHMLAFEFVDYARDPV